MIKPTRKVEKMSSETHNSYEVGDKVKVELSHSEVCMFMHVAGKVATIEILSRGVQIYTPEGEKFSFPILHGEAGVYVGSPDENGKRFYIPKDKVRD
jgi:hypothetical protein